MKYSECLNTVDLIVAANDVPLIIGESGVGKTSLVKQIAKDNGDYLVTIDANLLKEGEIGGLPIVDNGVTIYATHNKLQEIQKVLKDDEKRNVILFIDELNRCDHAVAQELMNLILNREINGYILSDKVKVIAAMNPSNKNEGFYNSRYDVVDMDPAQEDRFVWVRLDSDIKEWINWGMSDNGNIHEHIIEFLSTFPEYLHTPDSEETIKATPRSWERVSKAYNIYLRNKEKYSFDTFFNVVKGNIGIDIGNDFSSFLTNLKKPLISVEDIFNNEVLNFELKDRIEKESHSRLYIVVKNSLKYLEVHNIEKNLKLFSEFLNLYPRDLRLGIMKEIKRDYSKTVYKQLLETEEFLDSFFNIFN
ncbi:AAA family ATPase [Clostridium saccharoperbutylacetonicum]|uniref:ATPase family associated with various cellular activities n=1 Tax=Clostridium saccharoperbutylacetonicum N1-4(HMT) TaxID=931276 RepID=M1MMC3_9CLOT|nr:AAA family ATPase [Clostridium saccharoperbutylacetonicum]AGF59069.1 ATPase family associated with various cellular activities [Clostridium saccharoperbutylacetonicum N1-4(HMT)]AQR97738.1 ATPase family [Clostridium saccharoperbutylacetonicum]NRT60143.1 MoxR-like ATPase [Clostridium saccharoperbutylacetonicum]NSB23455.1 MoxR-like ATPase [Clostridium saccharoperbutylacetonicum]NSB33626.1 MoxR-like ATPase [Clostridium saccharoperbutylacetonicum]